MEITKSGFSILTENEISYFNILESVISSVDNYCYLSIIKNPDSYFFRISPSDFSLTNLIILELNNLHNLINIRLEYSKSMKTSSAISFKILLNNN